MNKRPSGLGRGLGSLIPAKPAAATAVADKPGSGVSQVPVSAIVVNPEQPRSHFRTPEMEDLAASIKEHGIIQPLVVSARPEGGYELVAGERRLRAAKLAGLNSVPVVVRPSVGSNQEKLVLALIENIQRADLNPIEEGSAYRKLVDDFGFTQEEVAKKVGKARPTVANAIRLLDLPEEIRQAVASGEISAGTARAILGLKDDAARLAYFRKIMGRKATTREAEQDVRRAGGERRDAAVEAIEDELRHRLGTKVEIKKRGGKGSIVISFFSEEEYNHAVDVLRG
ncbi:MAG: ParB/RepB/Spo0J family partition protein [Patescibacteria group bacterium]|nr:ParB/RepB/Spo0J family partition protein [Patescibacteria group bacterium]